MRTFIVIVVASLIPAGMWIAGCRRDTRQAAFPDSSEIQALAKAPESAAPTTPPVIHAAPIDRDILNLPETPTMARVNAVNDRSRQIARAKAPDGLFNLPEGEDRYAMAAPAPYEAAPAPAAITPIPSAREFWSRPVAQVDLGRRPSGIPEDIAAMAAPGPIGDGGGSASIVPPAPYLAPIPSNAGGQFIPEDVPGVFMGGQPLSMHSGGPPTDRARFSGLSRTGGAQGAAPLSSPASSSSSDRGGLFTLDLAGLIGASPVGEPESRAAMPEVDRAIVVRSIPGDYEPLPEPVPLAEYTAARMKELDVPGFGDSVSAPPAAVPAAVPASVPDSASVPVSFNALTAQPPIPGRAPERTVEAAKPSVAPALPPPPLSRETPVDVSVSAKAGSAGGAASPLFDAGDMQAALAPLQSIVAVSKPVQASAPSAVSGSHQTPELAAAKTALTGAGVKGAEKTEKPEKAESFEERDVFRMDFWDKKSDGASGKKDEFELLVPDSAPPMKGGMGKGKESEGLPLWIDDIPEIREPAKSVSPVHKVEEKQKAESRASAPKKITLHPVRKVDSEMGRIDSSAEAPPMRF